MGKLITVDTFNRVNYFSQIPEVGTVLLDEARDIDDLVVKLKKLVAEIQDKQDKLVYSVEEDWTKEEIVTSLGNKFYDRIKRVYL